VTHLFADRDADAWPAVQLELPALHGAGVQCLQNTYIADVLIRTVVSDPDKYRLHPPEVCDLETFCDPAMLFLSFAPPVSPHQQVGTSCHITAALRTTGRLTPCGISCWATTLGPADDSVPADQ